MTVEHHLVCVERAPSRVFYRLEFLQAVAITENVDHDVLTFRAGGDTQCFPVEDAEAVETALSKLLGRL